jgi:protein involved in polysaccharide export with SLBB domain
LIAESFSASSATDDPGINYFHGGISLFRKLTTGITIALAFAIARPAIPQTSQQTSESPRFRDRAKEDDEKQQARLKQKQAEHQVLQQALMQAIERPVDPASYIVGPGDVIKINFWGPASDDLGFSTTITPEGKIIIPTVGALDVIDKTLQQVQQEIRLACEKKYDPKSMSVTAYLIQLRPVRAHVYGEVESPGSFSGIAVDRVSSFIQQAEGWTNWADERRIELRHANGKLDTLDMFKLYYEGDLRQDPYVRGGEIIYAPRIELSDKTVFVEGEAERAGPHQIAKDETLMDFLRRVKALHHGGDMHEIFLVRRNQAPVRISFFGDAGNGNDARHLRMEDGDRLIVKGGRDFVYVHGAVKNPGNYQYVEGYKVADYVGLAGGTTEMGGLGSAKVTHRDSGKTEKGTNKEVRRGDTVMVPVATRSTISQYLSIVSQLATLLIAASAVGLINNN